MRFLCSVGSRDILKFSQHVDDLYKEHLVEKGDAAELVKLGHVPDALELFVQQGNWLKVTATISQMPAYKVIHSNSVRESLFQGTAGA